MDELKKQVTDAIDVNWGTARARVRDTLDIGIEHARGAFIPAVQPIVDQAKVATLTFSASTLNLTAWADSNGVTGMPSRTDIIEISSDTRGSPQTGLAIAERQYSTYKGIADVKLEGTACAFRPGSVHAA